MAGTKRIALEMTMEESSTRTDKFYAATGTKPSDAGIKVPATFTNARDADTRLMELSNAVALRRPWPKTPLIADRWEVDLQLANILTKYPLIPSFLRYGAFAGIPQIKTSFFPRNKASTGSLEFNSILQVEFDKGRCIGPFQQESSKTRSGHSNLYCFPSYPNRVGRPSFVQSKTS